MLALTLYTWIKDTPELDLSLLDKSYYITEEREWIDIDDMPENLIDAFVSIEDIRFYKHKGVDTKRFCGAVLGQFTGSNYGGSTITQQLIKNVYLTNEVTYKRKAQEIWLALNLETKMSKDEILECYLNIIYFGDANYGVGAAAKNYFGKDLDELTLKECALLAGLAKNPNGYNPRINMYIKDDISRTDKRTNTVLWNMYDKGFITEKEYNQALEEEYNIINIYN